MGTSDRDYVAPWGELNELQSCQHLQQIQRTWEYPIWRYRSGRLNQLLDWAIRQCRSGSVARKDSAAQLEEAMHQTVRFVEDIHSALNPEGAKLATKGDVPSKEADSKAHFRWTNLVGRVWDHMPPEHSFAHWKQEVIAKRIPWFPLGCNVEAVISTIDEYWKFPHLHHPWIEWMFFDALIHAATVSVANDISLIEQGILAPARYRKGFIEFLFGLSGRARQGRVNAEAAPHRVALHLMLKTYSGLDGGGWTVSPTRIRELMDMAEQVGSGWPPAAYVMIDRAVAENAGTWNFEPP